MTKRDETTKAASPPVADVSETAAGNVDKIRDILFGNQIQDYNRRFERLEKRLEKAASDLREDTKKRLDSLETYVRKEAETLLARIGAEADERGETDSELNRELRDTAKRLSTLTEKTAAAQRDLHKGILDQSKTLRDELRKSHKEISSELNAASKELRCDKVDRTELAALLVEVARRLGGGQAEAAKAGQDSRG